GSTEDSADGSCRRVGKQGLVHFGFEAIGLLQSTLVFFTENAALSSGTKEGSKGIKRKSGIFSEEDERALEQTKNAALSSGTKEGSKGIKSIRHREGEDCNQYHREKE